MSRALEKFLPIFASLLIVFMEERIFRGPFPQTLSCLPLPWKLPISQEEAGGGPRQKPLDGLRKLPRSLSCRKQHSAGVLPEGILISSILSLCLAWRHLQHRGGNVFFSASPEAAAFKLPSHTHAEIMTQPRTCADTLIHYIACGAKIPPNASCCCGEVL